MNEIITEIVRVKVKSFYANQLQDLQKQHSLTRSIELQT